MMLLYEKWRVSRRRHHDGRLGLEVVGGRAVARLHTKTGKDAGGGNRTRGHSSEEGEGERKSERGESEQEW